MPYPELRKLYYGDEAAYAAEYAQRVASPDTVKLNLQINGKQAFFVETTEVLRLVRDIERLDKEVRKLRMELPEIAALQYTVHCLIGEIVLTNQIEGVHSSRKEIGEVLRILAKQSEQKGKRPRMAGLVKKYRKLLAEEEIQLQSCQDIRDIYDELFLDEVLKENPDSGPDGEIFRKDSVTVYSGTGKEIHQGLYPEKNIIETMTQALNFLHDESVDILYRICLFHYLVEYIHPFYDGNGRLGRFILSYGISRTLEPLLAYRISEVIKADIHAYYEAFQTCNDPHELGDLTPFLLMQLRMLRAAAEKLRDALRERSIRWNRYQALIPGLPGAEADRRLKDLYELLIQAALFSENGISTAELIEVVGVSYQTVQKLLDRIPPELLSAEKKGKIKYYQLNLQPLDDMLLKAATESAE